MILEAEAEAEAIKVSRVLEECEELFKCLFYMQLTCIEDKK